MNSLHWQLTNTYRTLPKTFYSEGNVAEFPSPNILLFNRPLAEEIGLLEKNQLFDNANNANIFSGNAFPDGAKPLSQAYAGHQFGHFNMLGDGRATLIGEQVTPNGKLVDIQLKGNGITPYSRRGDGQAALAPMLREYLISEAMYALNIPTSRSLAVTTTGQTVYREHPLAGAVLTRTAASHIRVATFQYALAFGERSDVKALADYVIERHFPQILTENAPHPYLLLLQTVIDRQAQLIAKWQLNGFIHGVMNTDNMAISGETIDYGPCAFMDYYHPQTVFSSIDRRGRYRYENQPIIAEWNLTRFAETLLSLLSDKQNEAIELATKALETFESLFQHYYHEGMAKKLGLFEFKPEDKLLFDRLLSLMQTSEADYTNTFVCLTQNLAEHSQNLDGTAQLYENALFIRWQADWKNRLATQSHSRDDTITLMQSHNPFIIPRNFWVEDVLAQATEGNLQPFEQFLLTLQTPFDYTKEVANYQIVPPQDENYKTFCGT